MVVSPGVLIRPIAAYINDGCSFNAQLTIVAKLIRAQLPNSALGVYN